MKGQEVRIGNLFENESDGQILEVCTITKNGFFCTGNNRKAQFKAVPIKITSEWLKKFEFEKGIDYGQGQESITYSIKKNGLIIFSIWVMKCFSGFGINYDTDRSIKAKQYVHELQNLCYELSSIELGIK